MASVSTFMYCEGAQIIPQANGENKMHIQGPMHIFTPPYVPGLFSFSVVFGLLDIDLENERSFRLTFGPTEGPPLIDTDWITIPKNNDPIKNSLPPEMRGFMMNLDFRNVNFTQPGLYRSEVFFNGKKLGEYPIMVHQGAPNVTVHKGLMV